MCYNNCVKKLKRIFAWTLLQRSIVDRTGLMVWSPLLSEQGINFVHLHNVQHDTEKKSLRHLILLNLVSSICRPSWKNCVSMNMRVHCDPITDSWSSGRQGHQIMVCMTEPWDSCTFKVCGKGLRRQMFRNLSSTCTVLMCCHPLYMCLKNAIHPFN